MQQYLPAVVIVAIILVVIFSELVKRLDTRNRLKGYRVYCPAFFSLLFSYFLKVGTFIADTQVWFYGAVIFGVSVFAFEAILKKMQDKIL